MSEQHAPDSSGLEQSEIKSEAETEPPRFSDIDEEVQANIREEQLMALDRIMTRSPELEEQAFDPIDEFNRLKQLRGTIDHSHFIELWNQFNERYRQYREDLAATQTALIDTARAHPEYPLARLLDQAEQLCRQYQYPTRIRNMIFHALSSYSFKHTLVRTLRQRLPDDTQLFTSMYGVEPEGRVETIEGPMTLYFRCWDERDYARIYQAVFEHRGVEAQEIDESNKSGGVSARRWFYGIVLAENQAGRYTEAESETIRIHEEQHAFYHLFRYDQRELSVSEEQAQRLRVVHSFRRSRGSIEEAAKDELLAIMAENNYALYNDDAYMRLTKSIEDGGLYDFAHNDQNWRAQVIAAEVEANNLLSAQDVEELFEQVFTLEYHHLLQQAVDAAVRLELYYEHQPPGEDSMTVERLIAFLQHQPLAEWKSLANRLRRREPYIPKKSATS